MTEWKLTPNSNWKGHEGRERQALCHDQTPFLTIRCSNGHDNHMHASQIDRIPEEVPFIWSHCKECKELFEFERNWIVRAFQKSEEEASSIVLHS